MTNDNAIEAQPGRSERRISPGKQVLLLVLLWAGLYLPTINSLPLFDSDEAREALVVRHMIRSGDWLMPRLEGRPYYDKPAPYFWLCAAGRLITGDVEAGGRLVSVLFALMGILSVFAFARRAAGDPAGLLAGVILATSLMYFLLGRIYRMDMALGVLIWLAIWWFWRYERPEGPRPGDRWRRWLGFYVFCALATLMKGPIGLGLPALIVGAYLLLSGRSRRFFELFNPLGIAAYLLIAAPWYAAVSIVVPHYAYQFFAHQNLGRYMGETIKSKDMPRIFYIGLLFGSPIPWNIFLPGAVVRDFPRRWAARAVRPEVLLCWLATLIPLVFFMCSMTRMEIYVFPGTIPLAVLLGMPIAQWLRDHQPDKLFRVGGYLIAVASGCGILGGIATEIFKGWFSFWSLPVCGLVLLLAILAMRAAIKGRRRRLATHVTLALTATLMYGAIHLGPRALATHSCRSLGLAVKRNWSDGSVLASFGVTTFSYILYSGHENAVHFSDTDEGTKEAVKLLSSGREVFCMVRDGQALETLKNAGAPKMRILADNGRCLVITNRVK